MCKRQILVLAAMLALSTALKSQQNFLDSPDAYLGQPKPNDTPRIFAPGMLVDSGIVLGRLVFTPDGKACYYTNGFSWYNAVGAHTRYFVFSNGKWTGSRELLKNFRNPTLSPDGDAMYFSLHGGEVWRSEKTAGGWSQPVLYIKKNYGLYDFMPTRSGRFYVGSNGNGGNIKDFSTYDFCILTAASGDTTIQSLGLPLNTPAFDGDFFIAPDESYIIISAKETPSFECELYISYHKPDGSWTNPKSLGPLINDGVAHRFGQYVSPDQKYLFYSRGTSEKDCAFYWVRFDRLLDSLRHTNFEPYLKAKISRQSGQTGKRFSFSLPPGSFIDDDGNSTLHFTASLNNGEPLPRWLRFNGRTASFTGTPRDTGEYEFVVTATDPHQASAQGSFVLEITGG